MQRVLQSQGLDFSNASPLNYRLSLLRLLVYFATFLSIPSSHSSYPPNLPVHLLHQYYHVHSYGQRR